MTSVKALLAFGALAALLNSALFTLRAQSAPGTEPKVQSEPRLVQTNAAVARDCDVDTTPRTNAASLGSTVGYVSATATLDETVSTMERSGVPSGNTESRRRVLAFVTPRIVG